MAHTQLSPAGLPGRRYSFVAKEATTIAIPDVGDTVMARIFTDTAPARLFTDTVRTRIFTDIATRR